VVEARRDTFKAPKPDAVRLLAFDLITEVNRNEGYSNLLLPAALNASSLEDRDRNLVTELVYGTLRMQGKHDWVLAQISDRPWNEVDSGIIDVARMGVHQIHELRIPDHAAVSATVEVARKRLVLLMLFCALLLVSPMPNGLLHWIQSQTKLKSSQSNTRIHTG